MPSPATSDYSDCPSTSSYLPRARGSSRGTSRGQSRGRNRGRGENSQLISTRHIAIRNRQNNSGIQDTWIHDTSISANFQYMEISEKSKVPRDLFHV